MTTDYGYQLPLEIDPSEKVCFQILVPNDLYHIAAFKGQIWELTRWFNWAKDEAHTALEVAEVWKQIYEQVRASEGCDPMAYLNNVRQNTDNPCTLEKTFDGATWESFANLLLCQPKLRYNGGLLQWYNPVTGQWETADSGDERYDGSAPPPWPSGTVPPGEDGACLAAENIAATWQSALTELKAGLTIGRDVLALTTGLAGTMSLFIPQTLIAAIAQSIVLVVVQGGISFIDTMLDHIDEFKCSVRCAIESDGSVTAADFNKIEEDIQTWASGLELEVLTAWLDGFGSVGLTRQGRAAGITTGDCTDCECEWSKPFPFQTGGAQGWVAQTASGQTTPTYVGGTGWYKPSDSLGQGVSQACIITLTLPGAAHFTGCDIRATLSGGAGSDSHNLAFGGGSSITSPVPYYPAVEPGISGTFTQHHDLNDNVTIVQIHAYINCPGASFSSGGIAIEHVTLSGTGTEPTWP